jgi:hypothetical protein
VITVDIGRKTEYGVEEHVIKVTGVSESRDVRYLLSAQCQVVVGKSSGKSDAILYRNRKSILYILLGV